MIYGSDIVSAVHTLYASRINCCIQSRISLQAQAEFNIFTTSFNSFGQVPLIIRNDYQLLKAVLMAQQT